MKGNVGAVLSAAALSLVACSGSGGGAGFAPSPSPSATNLPNASSVSGMLVDDPSGTPLAGVAVRLDPWQWGSGPVSGAPTLYTPPPNLVPGPSPTPMVTTTTDPQGRFTLHAPNGTYLLVVGSDDSNDTTRPTIHDRIVLRGQTVLVAPTMPPVPGITPSPVELSGNYRLATIDQSHELPCINDYDQQRILRGLAQPVIDEWLTENVRALVNQSVTVFNGLTNPNNRYGFLTSGNVAQTGGTSCVMGIAAFSNNATAFAQSSPWYAGSYLSYKAGSAYGAYGASLFPADPRLFQDANVPKWP